ncbi:MAG TPA: exosortase A [Aquabacterium sp.]|nr:exosortase A [Aquabacterium sp.]
MTEIRVDQASNVPAPPAAPGADAWRRAMPPLALLLVAVGLFFFESFRGMEAIWSRSDTFAHAYVVPPIALWLIWRRRAELALQLPVPSPWLLPPFALLLLVWLVGQLAAANAVTQLAATALLVLTVPLLLGVRVALVILFPLAYLFFAVPIGEFMIPPLMQGTADFTVAALRLSGIPVYREGLQFMIPSGNWSVVEACSGVRYLMASFMVGSLFAYLNYTSTKRRFIFALVSLAVPVVANWLRAYMIVMLGHLSGNQIAVGADHLVYGWVFFGVVITIVFMIGARWSEDPAPAPVAGPVTPQGTASSRRPWGLALVAAVLTAVPQLALTLIERGELTTEPRLVLSPAPASGWRGAPVDASSFKPAFRNPNTELLARFVADDSVPPVGLYLAYYRRQDESRKLVSSENMLVTLQDRQWNAVASELRSVALEGGRTMTVRETTLLQLGSASATGRGRLLVWQVYWVNGTLTANDHAAKLLGAWYRLTGRGDDGAAIVLDAPDAEGRPAAAALNRFTSANLAAIEQALDATRAAR